MRFLADENIPNAAVQALVAAGFDVFQIASIEPGAPDLQIAELSARESRIILTFDKDFGEIAVAQQMPVPGVILFRLAGMSPDQVMELIVKTLQSGLDWNNHFSVIDNRRIRMRRLANQ